MSKTGVVYIKVRFELEYDIDEDEVENMVKWLDYKFNDDKKRIQNAEIVDFSTSRDF